MPSSPPRMSAPSSASTCSGSVKQQEQGQAVDCKLFPSKSDGTATVDPSQQVLSALQLHQQQQQAQQQHEQEQQQHQPQNIANMMLLAMLLVGGTGQAAP